MKLGLDIDDSIEKFLDDIFAVRLERLVEFFELLFSLLVYGVLRVGG